MSSIKPQKLQARAFENSDITCEGVAFFGNAIYPEGEMRGEGFEPANFFKNRS